MLLILLGAPGSGKGTLSEKLSKHNGFEHVSTGNIFRNLSKKSTPLAMNVKQKLDNGILIDNQTTWEVVEDAFKNFDFTNQKIILDGYPRNDQQFHMITEYISEKNIEYKIIYFDIDEQEVINRLSNRLFCPKCNRTYHKLSLKPKIEWVCDDDGTELLQREDDKPENIKHRLQVYKNETLPILESARKLEHFYSIDVSRGINDIYNEVLKII